MSGRFTHTNSIQGNFFMGRPGLNQLPGIGLKCNNLSRLKRCEALLEIESKL